jgi:hypothetical protein
MAMQSATVLEEHVTPIFKVKEYTMQNSGYYLLHADFLLALFFDPEDGSDMFL